MYISLTHTFVDHLTTKPHHMTSKPLTKPLCKTTWMCDIKFSLLNMRDGDAICIYQREFNAVGAIAINDAYVSHKSS